MLAALTTTSVNLFWIFIESGYCQLVNFPIHNSNLLDLLLNYDEYLIDSI